MDGMLLYCSINVEPVLSGVTPIAGESPFPFEPAAEVAFPRLDLTAPARSAPVAGLLPLSGLSEDVVRDLPTMRRAAAAIPPDNPPMKPRMSVLAVAPSFTDDKRRGSDMRWAEPAKRLLSRFPGGWKVLALGTPLALSIVMYSVVTHPPAVAASSSPANSGAIGDIRKRITERAAINLTDDFRTGLYAWEGREDWGSSWSYDEAGFVHPGRLALYSPSAGLTDYSFEFVGQIRKRGMGWAFRAANLDNYYAVKLVVTRPGPVPSLALVRYSVVRGKEYGRTQVPVRIDALNDALYRIRVDVQGSRFSVWVNGRMADTWEDTRLKAGGIGFFSDSGEESLLRWMAISHQSDLVGKLCAALAG